MTLSIKALTFDTGGKILDRGLSTAPVAAAGAGRLEHRAFNREHSQPL